MLTNFLPTDATIFGGCHHSRSHEYYFESILYPTGFVGYPCESYKSYEAVSISAQEWMKYKENNQGLCTQDRSHHVHRALGHVWFCSHITQPAADLSSKINLGSASQQEEAQHTGAPSTILLLKNECTDETTKIKRKIKNKPHAILTLSLYAKSVQALGILTLLSPGWKKRYLELPKAFLKRLFWRKKKI